MAGTASDSTQGPSATSSGMKASSVMVARERAASPRAVLPGGQAEEDPMADHVAFIVRAIERGHVEHQVLDALLHQPFDRFAREVRRHQVAVVARAFGGVVRQRADDGGDRVDHAAHGPGGAQPPLA